MNRKNSSRQRVTGTTTRLPPYLIVPTVGFAGSLLYGYWYFQDEAPFTGRKRLLATSPEWEKQLGEQEYKKLLKHYNKDILPPNHRASITVHRVGSRIAEAAEKFIKEQEKQRQLSTSSTTPSQRPIQNYTYTVVRSDIPNAFVLPNNHVFVLTGLFQFVKDEEELAAVLGHEMAHNLARHAGERMSNSILTNIIARSTLLVDPSGVLYSIFLPAATLLHDLPHSRDHEIEADYIGLQLAADACFDPRAAKRVFASMKQKEDEMKRSKRGKKKKEIGGSSPSEFMSTHPSYDTRLSNFDDWMPEAMNKFNEDGGFKCQKIRQEMKLARKRAALVASAKKQKGR